MKYVLNAKQMKEADSRMIQQIGIPSLVLMERAAQQCVEMINREKRDFHTALVVCGSGNNGGDGFAVSRMLYEDMERQAVRRMVRQAQKEQQTFQKKKSEQER